MKPHILFWVIPALIKFLGFQAFIVSFEAYPYLYYFFKLKLAL